MRNSKTLVQPEIHVDLLIEILARLPAKSVIRFKCISKLWSSLLCSSYFCNRFVMLLRPSPRLYMCLLDWDDNSKSLLLSSDPTPTTCPSSIELNQDLTIGEMGGCAMRLLRGFICFLVQKEARIYNPSTRQLVILPAIESDILAEEDEDRVYVSYFIVYEPVNDQYKLVCTVALKSKRKKNLRSELWVFVLEAGGLWKRVAKDFRPHLTRGVELIMNGVLYYLAYTDSHTGTCVLVSFDIKSEEFNMIHLPRRTGDELIQIDYGGKVAVFDMTYLEDNGTVDLWIVEDWSKNEWSMKTLVVKPCQKHLLTGNYFMPTGTTPKGEVVLVPKKLISPFYVLCYDLQTNDLQKVEIKGIPDRWFSEPETSIDFDMRFMDPSENIKYLET